MPSRHPFRRPSTSPLAAAAIFPAVFAVAILVGLSPMAVALASPTLIGISAVAAEAVGQTSVVDWSPVVAEAQRWMTAIATALVTAIAGLVLAKLNPVLARIGLSQELKIDAQHRAALDRACANAAARIFARLDTALAARMKVDVGSPWLAQEVQSIVDHVPDAVSYFGLSPDRVSGKILAEFGRLQASAAGGLDAPAPTASAKS